MREKREVAALAIYRYVGERLEFYLQMRTADASVNPGLYDFFGGGLDAGETPSDALFREIKEELEYVPVRHVYFSRYENATHINNLFMEEVDKDFESAVVVHEGQYGKFMTLPEAIDTGTVFTQTQYILEQVSAYLQSNK